MSQFMAFFLLVMFSFHAKAENSFICPQSGLKIKNVTCCYLELSTCEKVIETGISESMLNSVNVFKQLYNEGYFYAGATPNCHWTAQHYHQDLIQSYYQVEPLELMSYLRRNFRPLEANAVLRKGDIIYFSFEAAGAGFIHASFRRTELIGTGSQAGFYDHSAIYIGENLVFQKENAFNDVFSVADFETVRKSYESDILKSYGLSGQLTWTAWRRAQ